MTRITFRVADDRHDVLVAPARVTGGREAERGGERVAGVAGDEGVRRAFVRIHERRLAPELPQRAERGPPAREELPGVGLVADVPEDAVAFRVEHAGQRARELDGAEGRGEVPAVLRHDLEDLLPQGIGIGMFAHACPPLRLSRDA